VGDNELVSAFGCGRSTSIICSQFGLRLPKDFCPNRFQAACFRSAATALILLTGSGFGGSSYAADPVEFPENDLVLEMEAAPAVSRVGPWIETGGMAGISGSGGRVDATLFSPIVQTPESLLFLQLDGRYFFDPDAQEGTAAIGYRWLGDDMIFGISGSYDVRQSDNDNLFHQLTLGGEILAPEWDIRANVYLPLSDAQAAPDQAKIEISAQSIAMIGALEVPLYGSDAEIGGLLAGSADNAQQLWGHVGGYYFDSADVPLADNVYGPQARLEYRLNNIAGNGSRLSFYASGRWDEMRGTQMEAGARLRIPLGGASVPYTGADPLASRMGERILRDPDIVVAGSDSEKVKDALTGVVFDQVHYTSELAPGDLGEAVAATDENTLLIVDEDYTTEQTISDGSNITIAGQAGAFSVAGARTGVIVEYTVPGTRRSIGVESDGDAVQAALTIDGSNIATGMHLVGLDVAATNLTMTSGADLYGMEIRGLTTPFIIEDMNIEAAGAVAPHAISDQRVYITGLYSDDSGSSASLTLLDSQITGLLDGGLTGTDASNDANLIADVRGLHTDASTVIVDGSTVSAMANGNISGGIAENGEATAFLYGIYAGERSNLSIIGDSYVSAQLNGDVSGGVDGQYASGTADLYGLHASQSIVSIADSTIFTELTGSISGGGFGSDASAELRSVHGNASTIDIDGAELYATITGNFSAGDNANAGQNTVLAYAAALSAENGSDISLIESNIHAQMTGDATGAINGNNITMHQALFGLAIDGSTITAAQSQIGVYYSGNIVGSTAGTENSLSTTIIGAMSYDSMTAIDDSRLTVEINGADATNDEDNFSTNLIYVENTPVTTDAELALSVTDSLFEMNDSAASGSAIKLESTENAANIKISNNIFTGEYETLLSINDENYNFVDDESINNLTEMPMGNASICSDGGVAWTGAFEIDEITYGYEDCE
jgi:hypothetical protein